MEIKDSGTRRDFGTGSVRDAAEGKGRFDLLPEYAIQAIALHFENGAKKYGDDNWRLGQPLKTYLDAALRHLFKFSRGEYDEPHLLAGAWNVMCLIDTLVRINRGLLPGDLNNLRARVPDEACGNITDRDLLSIKAAPIPKKCFVSNAQERLEQARKEEAEERKLNQLIEDVRKIHSPDPEPDPIYGGPRPAPKLSLEYGKALREMHPTLPANGKPKCYYAHPLSDYNTVQEASDIDTLKALGFEVINPNTPTFQKVFDEKGSAVGMDLCVSVILGQADLVAFRSFSDGTIGAGVMKEIRAAWNKRIPVIEMENCPQVRELTIEATREKIRQIQAKRSTGSVELDEWRMLL